MKFKFDEFLECCHEERCKLDYIITYLAGATTYNPARQVRFCDKHLKEFLLEVFGEE